MNKILLAPSLSDAEKVLKTNEPIIATVEAEYGEICIPGEKYTLAHHGSRSSNPAPCNVDNIKKVNGTILISHIDLDTIGGILALNGDKPEDPAFWKGAEFIDINGPHYIHKLEQDIQDKLNAFYAWNEQNREPRHTGLVDVANQINNYSEAIKKILNEKSPEHKKLIENGRAWEADMTKQTEQRLITENKNVRYFETDGVFCSSSYYSPTRKAMAMATVVYNEKFKSITLAFAKKIDYISAANIVQDLWGTGAGGRDTIAGSPRGQEMTKKDAVELCNYTDRILSTYLELKSKGNISEIEKNDISDEIER